jgi:hypothetical protein
VAVFYYAVRGQAVVVASRLELEERQDAFHRAASRLVFLAAVAVELGWKSLGSS